MTQHVYHVCPHCGRRIRCNKSTEDINTVQVFDALANNLNQSHIELSATRAYPTIKYEVYWGISQIADSLLKTLAFWIPANVAVITAATYYKWPVSVPGIFSVVSLVGFLRLFGKVPEWHNMIESEPPAEPDPAPEPEDTRRFVGWETTDQTKTTMHMEWYTPPVPVKEARSFALAVYNRGFEWIAERDLRRFGAQISGPNFRTLRQDWITRGWCAESGRNNATMVVNRHMVKRVAFEEPQ